MRYAMRIALAMLTVIAVLAVADYATRPISLTSTIEAAVKPPQAKDGMVMYLVSLVPGTRAVWHKTPYKTRQPAVGDPIEPSDLQSKLEFEHAKKVHNLTMPTGEVAEVAKAKALEGFRGAGFIPDDPTIALSRPVLIPAGDDDPTGPRSRGDGGNGGCDCYFGQPCPSGCCGTIFGDPYPTCTYACLNCKPV